MLSQILKDRGPLQNRDDLARLFAELKFKVGAEIGVERAWYSEVLFQSIPGLKLYCIDPWSPYAKVTQGRSDRLFTHARMKLAPYNAVIIKKTSIDALKDIPDHSLDFVYIDGMHDFDNIEQDIRGWHYKVKIGGIVSGHDYVNLHRRNLGVIRAVDEYVKRYSLILHLTQDELPSWFCERRI